MYTIDTKAGEMENELVTWIAEELAARKRSQRWLARESGLSHSAVTNIVSGYQPPTWAFCAAIAEPLGRHPVDLFKMAGLLEEPPAGEDEPQLLHTYRQLTPPNQHAAIAMLRGLAGIQPPPAQPPAPGADIDAVCKLLARLDSSRLEMAAIFIRWLLDQPDTDEPESRPATWEDVARYLASLSPEKRETLLTNLIRRFGRQGKNPDTAEDTHSESDSGPRRGLNQGTLF